MTGCVRIYSNQTQIEANLYSIRFGFCGTLAVSLVDEEGWLRFGARTDEDLPKALQDLLKAAAED
jgi:hypothetical protein